MSAYIIRTIAILALLVLPPSVAAKVSADEAARLGAELTPMGAVRAGNAAGTIPEWSGGYTKVPEDYEPGDYVPDPFPDDPVLFAISAANVDHHAEHLSEGQQALLRAHPDSWRMNVYRSRRTAAYPDWVYEAVIDNATRAEVVLTGKGSVDGSRVGPAFPIPSSGVEAVWNHNLRWRGLRVTRAEGSAAVTRSGRYNVVLAIDDRVFPYAAPNRTAFEEVAPNILTAVRQKVVAPALVSGEGTLAVDPLDQTRDPRKVWRYVPHLRQAVRAPWAAYDSPSRYGEGIQTVDDIDLFNGPPDRFEWKLLGRREMYVPYNAYRLDSEDLEPDDILETHHIAPEHARYELHRVWVVEGTLKPGASHVYSRRVFHIDEDSWTILVADNYDLEGRLWRTLESHPIVYPSVPVFRDTIEVYNDLLQRRYLVTGLDNDYRAPRFRTEADPREFSPNALLYYVR